MKKPRYFFFTFSQSFKQFFFSLSFLLLLSAAIVYSAEPGVNSGKVTIGDFSQMQTSAFLAVVGVALVPLYYLLAKIFHSTYKADPNKKSGPEDWMK